MSDRFTVRSVVVFLGVFAIVGLLSLVWLIDHDAPAADLTVVAGLTGTALGSMGTLLATTKSGPTEDEWRQLAAVNDTPTKVQVQQPPNTPVPMVDVGDAPATPPAG